MKKIYALLGCLLLAQMLWAQSRTVSGKVTGADDGEPIPGVNVLLKGTGTGASTDIEGNYKLTVPEEGGVLVFFLHRDEEKGRSYRKPVSS